MKKIFKIKKKGEKNQRGWRHGLDMCPQMAFWYLIPELDRRS
jgi:hypothetical protein